MGAPAIIDANNNKIIYEITFDLPNAGLLPDDTLPKAGGLAQYTGRYQRYQGSFPHTALPVAISEECSGAPTL